MKTATNLGLLLLGTCLTACGARTYGTEVQAARPTGGDLRGAPSAMPQGAAKSSAAYDGAPSAPRAEESEERAEAGPRPGLGTSWGEPIDSRVTTTSFIRDERLTPSATASFFYDDESGVEAMARGRFVDFRESTTTVGRGAIRVSLVDASGSPLRAAVVDGRTIAVGSEGDRYVIRIENRSPMRIEAVATVDGLDVLDGDDGDVRKRGYVVSPNDTLDIEGFRESSGTVRAFRFGATDDSYASLRGKGRNVGVVGVAIFRERGSHGLGYTEEELERRETAEPFPGRYAPPPPSRW